MEKNLLKTSLEKEKILVTSIFSFSHNVFCPSQTKFQFFSHIFFFSSAKPFNLDWPKILSFGKGLMHVERYRSYNLFAVSPSISVITGFQTLRANDDTLHLECYSRGSRPEITAITFYVVGQPVSQPYNFNQTQVVCSIIQEPDQVLTLSQATNFLLFQNERVSIRQFQM